MIYGLLFAKFLHAIFYEVDTATKFVNYFISHNNQN